MDKIKIKGLDEEIYVYKHRCGLTTYMWVNNKVNSFYAALNVKYGSLNTEFKKNNKIYKVPYGVAHFLEHIKFNVDANKTVYDIFNKIGGDANAFTTFKYTSYLVFANQNFKDNLSTLIRYVYNPYFTKKTVQKEKGIILEEAKMTFDDPYSELYYSFLKNIFNKAKYRYYITGDVDDIKNISLEDITNVYNTFYHPKNMFLCVTGNINPYDVAKTVDDTLNDIKFPEFERFTNIFPKENKKVNKKYEVLERNVATTKVRFGIKIPLNKFKKYDKVKLSLIINLIISANLGSTSDFKNDLISDEVVTYFSVGGEIYDDYFIISVIADTNYPDEFLSRLKEKINNFELNKKDIERKRKAILATMILSFDDIEVVAMKITDDIIQNGKIIDNEKEILENLTFDEVRDVFDNLDLKENTTLIVKPKK